MHDDIVAREKDNVLHARVNEMYGMLLTHSLDQSQLITSHETIQNDSGRRADTSHCASGMQQPLQTCQRPSCSAQLSSLAGWEENRRPYKGS